MLLANGANDLSSCILYLIIIFFPIQRQFAREKGSPALFYQTYERWTQEKSLVLPSEDQWKEVEKQDAEAWNVAIAQIGEVDGMEVGSQSSQD